MKSITKLVFPFRFFHTLNEGFIKCVLQSPLVDLEGVPGMRAPLPVQFLPPTNLVCGKVIFYTCLSFCSRG